MAKMQRSVFVRAPVDKIFGFMDQPATLPEIWPGLIEATDVQRLPNGGKQWRWTYKMAGLPYKGASEDLEWVENRRVVSKTIGGIDSTFVWTYEPEGEGTRVTVEVEYTIPLPVLGKLAEALVVKLNENDMDALLKNMKKRMEA